MKTKIKICGIDSLETALYCFQNNIDYLGLHFFAKYTNKEKQEKIELYKNIRSKLPTACLVLVVRPKYGINTNNGKAETVEIVSLCRDIKIDYLQLNYDGGQTSGTHINHYKKLLRDTNLDTGIIAVLDKTKLNMENAIEAAKEADFLLFESGSRGGSGIMASDNKMIDILPLIGEVGYFYAGGLNPANVESIIRKTNPFAVDVQSGVENEDHSKNKELITAFIDSVKKADDRVYNIDWQAVEKENVVSKLKFLTLLEDKNKFGGQQVGLEKRIQNMLDCLPRKYHTAAVAALSGVIYITEQMLVDAWKTLWYQYKNDYSGTDRLNVKLGDAHIFELDRDGLMDSFFRTASVNSKLDIFFGEYGRLDDTSPIDSVNRLLNYIFKLDSSEAVCLSEKETTELYVLKKKKHWILLVDITLSGKSICSEIKRIQVIAEHILKAQDIDIAIFIQTATEQARESINELLENSNVNIKCYYAIQIPYECAFNYKDESSGRKYSLIKDEELISDIDKLCTYFAEKVIKKYKSPINKAINKKIKNSEFQDAEDYAKYGFGGLGWNVITYKNAPNNSLPFLWCQPVKSGYSAPFCRIESRVNSAAGAQAEIDSIMEKWKKDVFDQKILDIERLERMHTNYKKCLEEYPDIENQYGGDDE